MVGRKKKKEVKRVKFEEDDDEEEEEDEDDDEEEDDLTHNKISEVEPPKLNVSEYIDAIQGDLTRAFEKLTYLRKIKGI